MKKKNGFVLILIVIALFGTIFALKLIAHSRNEQTGREQFNKAISELRISEPQYDNPCLGGSVLRNHSYSELSKKSISEIKDLARIHPGDC